MFHMLYQLTSFVPSSFARFAVFKTHFMAWVPVKVGYSTGKAECHGGSEYDEDPQFSGIAFWYASRHLQSRLTMFGATSLPHYCPGFIFLVVSRDRGNGCL